MPSVGSTNRLKLSFADVVISLASVCGSEGFEIDPAYSHFLCQEEPEVALQVHCDRHPSVHLGKLVFDTAGSWRLYRSGEKRVVRLHNPVDPARASRVAVFSPGFLAGDIYMGEQPDTELLPYPLGYPLDEVLMVNLLAGGRGVLLHACGVSDGGLGYIFAGTSGAGKSTLATLWEGREGVTLLSDDRVIVRQRDGRFWVYGTPWHGDARVASPQAVPLEQLFVIRHAPDNRAVRLKPADAASRLLVRSFPTFWDAEGMAFTLEFLGELCQAVPCYELGFLPDESAVDYVRCLTSA